MSGEPVPRGGERAEPNPQFLHHAERLSELYVLLVVQAPTVGLRLHDFKREGEAREAFRANGRERALAPDALTHVHDDNGRGLLAFVELDLGTMSHARLKTKAAGYAAYASTAAWTDRHPFCPCLLFLTTTETRAISFLKSLNTLLDKRVGGSYYGHRRGYLAWFAAAACVHACEPERALSEACWDDLALAGGGLALTDCLNKARVAYDATRAKEEAEQRARDTERERLRSHPDVRRAYLQEKPLRFHGEHLAQFGAAGATALHLLPNTSEPMSDIEQDAFTALARQLADDPLDAEPTPNPVPPTWTDTEAVALLVEVYLRRQQTDVNELARRCGDGPTLRRYRQQLANDGLLSRTSWDALAHYAQRDQDAREEQEKLRLAYLAQRDREARQRKHEASLTARLAHGHNAMYPTVDRDRLRICHHCDEIAYPAETEPRAYGSYGYLNPPPAHPSHCHFCGGSQLDPWDKAYLPLLEHGTASHTDVDLTSAGIDGLMDDHGNPRSGL